MSIRALAFNCSLKSAKGSETSSTDALLSQLATQLRSFDVETEAIRAVDHDIRPGTGHDMGKGDAWPALREKLLACDIVAMATPIWLGQPSSVATTQVRSSDRTSLGSSTYWMSRRPDFIRRTPRRCSAH
jgi:multimeric flavodoxin WrbA